LQPNKEFLKFLEVVPDQYFPSKSPKYTQG
jgi:hypothetical protein